MDLGTEPIKVALLDVDTGVPSGGLACTRAGEPPYRSALIFVRRGGSPLGSVVIPLDGDQIPREVLEHECQRQLGERWTEPIVEESGCANLPSVTIVVPTTMRRRELLQRCVDHLGELDYPNYEVIVVDNRADGDAVDVSGAQVIRQRRPGCSAARNAGLYAAKGEVTAFVDDDVMVDRGWLRATAQRFATDPLLAAVTGMMLPATLDTHAEVLFERSDNGGNRIYEPLEFRRAGRFRVCRASLRDGVTSTYPIYATGEFGCSASFAFRTKILRESGGFDMALGPGTLAPAGEDLELLIRLLIDGHKLGYEPRAIVHHAHRVDIDGLRYQVRCYGIGFTAMLAAIVWRTPSQIVGLAGILPRALRKIPGRGGQGAMTAMSSADHELARTKLLGMALGPRQYFRSRAAQRNWQEGAGER